MRNTFQRCTARAALVVSFAALLYSPSVGLAGPILGAAQNFAVLGYGGVTNAHVDNNAQTQIYGNVGATPGGLAQITGFPPGIITGGTKLGTPSIADQALLDINTAYGYLAGLPVTQDLSLTNLGNRTLTPGVYSLSDVTALLTGTLTLDALGNPNARFVFQLANALTTASGSVVNVINGSPGTEIYWVLGKSAALGSGSTFAGNILAYSSISLGPTAMILCGRAFAETESVTLIDNFISNNNTAETFGVSGRPDFGSYGFSGGVGDTSGIPEPGTLTLLSLGLGAGFLLLRKFRSIR